MDQEPEGADAETVPVAAQRQGRRRRRSLRRIAVTPALFLFTRDLRVADNAGLAAAARAGPVVAALVLDPLRAERLSRSPRRAAFFCGAVAALAADLAQRGTTLVVRSGPALSTVRRLARETGAHIVAWSAGYDPITMAADSNLQASLEERGLRAIVVHDAPAIPPEETSVARSAGGAGYLALTPYLDAWDAAQRAAADARITFAAGDGVTSEPLPAPALFGSAEAAATGASSAAAEALLDAFLRGPALTYAIARDLPAQPTSQLAPHLSFGTIAARTVLRRVEQRAADPFLLAEERRSLRAFAHALAR